MCICMHAMRIQVYSTSSKQQTQTAPSNTCITHNTMHTSTGKCSQYISITACSTRTCRYERVILLSSWQSSIIILCATRHAYQLHLHLVAAVAQEHEQITL
jgi:hypothetical protein